MIRQCPSCFCPAQTGEQFCSGCGVWLVEPEAVASVEVPFTPGQRVRVVNGQYAGKLASILTVWRTGPQAGMLKVIGWYWAERLHFADVQLAMDDGMSGKRFDGDDLVPIGEPSAPVAFEAQRKWRNSA